MKGVALGPGERAWRRIRDAVIGPQPIERLELLRMLLPLAILAFLSQRLAHADEWLSTAGFQVPDLGHDDYRQPLYLPPLPVWIAWTFALGLVTSGVALAAGFMTRVANAVFAGLLCWCTLADRLEAFTVTKFGTALMFMLLFTPAGSRYGLDARRRGGEPPTHAPPGAVQIFQLALVVLYCSSGVAKSRGDWLHSTRVIWSQLHDSYQTAFTYFLATTVPGWLWAVFQTVTLIYECGAPLWYALPWTRPVAMIIGLGMHAAIGVMFGPVVWFSCLMVSLILGGFAPVAWIRRPLAAIWERNG